MSIPHIKLLSDGYKSYVFNGFSHLQEQQEFVDLTLAADGHIVKVHKNIIALASPYLKELLQQTPSNNPIIFLNNVSHTLLCYILEYVYQGEVSVPEDCIEAFIQVAKGLHIFNVNEDYSKSSNSNQVQTDKVNKEYETTQEVQSTIDTPKADESFAARITINSDHNFEVQPIPENLPEYQEKNVAEIVIHSGKILNTNNMPNIEPLTEDNYVNDIMDIDSDLTESPTKLEFRNVGANNTQTKSSPRRLSPERITLDQEAANALKTISQYSISERGSMQIIVNRFVYYGHHNSKGGRQCRWRCIDYRKLKCPAFIDSIDDNIIRRVGAHKHQFHDDKIYKKIGRKLVFSSAKLANQAATAIKTSNETDDN